MLIDLIKAAIDLGGGQTCDVDGVLRELDRMGFAIVPKRLDKRKLSWHRTMPVPEGVVFEDEAVKRIREQITADHLEFVERPSIENIYTIRSAFLRVFP